MKTKLDTKINGPSAMLQRAAGNGSSENASFNDNGKALAATMAMKYVENPNANKYRYGETNLFRFNGYRGDVGVESVTRCSLTSGSMKTTRIIHTDEADPMNING